ncbi:hypothetical protein ACW185_10605 [Limosilactobacillus fermentum]
MTHGIEVVRTKQRTAEETTRSNATTAIISNPPQHFSRVSDLAKMITIRTNIIRSLKVEYESHMEKIPSQMLLNTLMDSYIKALRWSTDRIGKQGIIGFVSNASFLDSHSTDGLRASLYKEFNHLYIFNLRGNQRTAGRTVT